MKMSEVKPSREALMKSIDDIIDEALGAEEASTEVLKSEAPSEQNPANGGDDKLKSGTPLTEEQKAEAAKKSKEKEEKDAKDQDDDKDDDKKGALFKGVRMLCYDTSTWTRENFTRGVEEYNKVSRSA